MKHSIKAFLAALSLWACTDSDQYLYEGELQEVQVSACLTTSFDDTNRQIKSDTIRPGDSLIFLSNVYPSKSIRSQNYFWQLDGKNFASEYSFRSTIGDPGTHEVAFVFVDFFGDTLSDTLTITVANQPILDNENYIPAEGTQNISPKEPLTFAWNASDPDNLWQLHHRFVLQDASNPQEILADTILDHANFVYHGHFSSLKKYTWSVTTFNELNQRSDKSISSHFFVKGNPGENSITGKVKTTADQEIFPFHIVVMDSSQNILRDTVVNSSEKAVFSFAPLPPGKYLPQTSIDDHLDFEPRLDEFTLQGDQVLELDSIILVDIIPPSILSTTFKDSLPLQSNLKFLVFDEGGPLSVSKITVKLDGIPVQGYTYLNDTLFVPLNADQSSWTYKILTISAGDCSDNRNSKAFYIKPNSRLQEVFGE